MSEDSSLPPTIVGALPSVEAVKQKEHRLQHTEFNPDGCIYRCSCGWISGLVPHGDGAFQAAWADHL